MNIYGEWIRVIETNKKKKIALSIFAIIAGVYLFASANTQNSYNRGVVWIINFIAILFFTTAFFGFIGLNEKIDIYEYAFMYQSAFRKVEVFYSEIDQILVTTTHVASTLVPPSARFITVKMRKKSGALIAKKIKINVTYFKNFINDFAYVSEVIEQMKLKNN